MGVGAETDALVVVGVILGIDNVRTTPALVPIHSNSLHVNKAVIRKHAVLCCRIMSSEAGKNTIRSISRNNSLTVVRIVLNITE